MKTTSSGAFGCRMVNKKELPCGHDVCSDSRCSHSLTVPSDLDVCAGFCEQM